MSAMSWLAINSVTAGEQVAPRLAVATNGDVVVALLGDEVTLKRLYRHDESTYRLQPANPELPPMFVSAEQLAVQGIVVGLVRRY